MTIIPPDTATFPPLAREVIGLIDRIKLYTALRPDDAADTEQASRNVMTYGQHAELVYVMTNWYGECRNWIRAIRTIRNATPWTVVDPVYPPEPDLDGYYVPSPQPEHRSISESDDLLPHIVMPILPKPRPPFPWPWPPPNPPVIRPVAEENYSYAYAYWYYISNEIFADMLYDRLRFEYWQYLSTVLFKHMYALVRFANEQPVLDYMCRDYIYTLKSALWTKND